MHLNARLEKFAQVEAFLQKLECPSKVKITAKIGAHVTGLAQLVCCIFVALCLILH